MNPVNAKRYIVLVVSHRTPMHPTLGWMGNFFPTHSSVNISKYIQDPQALESLKCRYYIEVQTGIPGIPNCLL